MPNATGLRRQRNINYSGPSGVHDYDVYMLQGYVDQETLTILDLLVCTITMYIYWCMAWLNGLYQNERFKDSVCSTTILNAIPYQSGILILE